ncbi:MAG: type IV toxin-antitoxin system AbiEi family antitoxin [Haliea sp.]|nr:type IV toxin-antitoxin system AbiEi family antitoxin [Haliea sp.]
MVLAESIDFRYFTRVESNKNPIAARKLIETLASKGRYSFTSEEAREALKVSPAASKLALNRLARQGQIASPARGFYVIVPPEYRSLGCLPAEQFIPDLMKTKDLNYYAGLLTAAQYYGAAHQRPQEFQVFVQKNRRQIHCGKVRVKFRKEHRRRPKIQHPEAHGFHPEGTAISPEHAGGLENVATVLSELANEIDTSALVKVAAMAPITWVQRLGYMLELVDAKNPAAGLRAVAQSVSTMLVKKRGGSASGWRTRHQCRA